MHRQNNVFTPVAASLTRMFSKWLPDWQKKMRLYTLRNFVMRPVSTHSATRMFPAASKQAS